MNLDQSGMSVSEKVYQGMIGLLLCLIVSGLESRLVYAFMQRSPGKNSGLGQVRLDKSNNVKIQMRNW